MQLRSPANGESSTCKEREKQRQQVDDEDKEQEKQQQQDVEKGREEAREGLGGEEKENDRHVNSSSSSILINNGNPGKDADSKNDSGQDAEGRQEQQHQPGQMEGRRRIPTSSERNDDAVCGDTKNEDVPVGATGRGKEEKENLSEQLQHHQTHQQLHHHYKLLDRVTMVQRLAEELDLDEKTVEEQLQTAVDTLGSSSSPEAEGKEVYDDDDSDKWKTSRKEEDQGENNT